VVLGERGDDRGEILLRARALEKRLASRFELSGAVMRSSYGKGLDLTGY